MSSGTVKATTWSNAIEVPGVGYEGQGAGLALGNLDSNSRPELILMAYDNPSGGNTFRYKIGWNVGSNGLAASWSNAIEIPGVGYEGQGADVVLSNLDSNSRPELILMAYDNPSGGNTFRYKIGWNVGADGIATSWSNYTEVPGVGYEGQGAGAALANLDGNSRPEMILMAYDNPSGGNTFRYKIGWNVGTNGLASSWSNTIEVPGVGYDGHGAAVSLVGLDGDPRPEMILMAYDNASGANSFRYKIGWNVGSNGQALSWSGYQDVPGVGNEGQGAGIALAALDGNSRPEMILMAYDNPSGANTFRYKIGWNFTLSNEDTDNQFVAYVSDEEDRFEDYAGSFVDEFDGSWPCTQYYWGQSRFLDSDHLSFADSADLAYVAGHGAPSYIVMSGGQGCTLTNCAWGSYSNSDHTGDLEYIVLHSCSVLEMNTDWRDRWRHNAGNQSQDRPFSGLHMAMGFRTLHYNGAGAGAWEADEFAENLEDGYSVRYAWYEAVEDARWLAGWQGNKPAVFYIRPHENETISQHNSEDYHFGDPDYLLDAYYME